MDIQISNTQKRKERNMKILKFGGIIAIIVIIFLSVLNLIGNSVQRKDLSFGNVDRGAISITVSATGKVIPLNEKIIVAPINSRIMEIYKNAGDSVHQGEPILLLELASIKSEYDKKQDESQIKKSKLVQSQISLQNKISEMKMEAKVKDMKLKQMLTDLKNEYYLDSIGATTKDKIREKQLNCDVAKLELDELKQKITNEQKNSNAEQNVQQLEYNIFEKELAETARLLKDARVLAPQNGTLTYVNDQLGTQVDVGTQIAILSDLSKFKVEAEIADSYADKLSAGAKAIIKSGVDELQGTVINITPSSKNGVIKFMVILDNADSNKLRSGLKVDVYVQHGLKDNVLRIPNIATYFGPGKYDMWVVSGDEAQKRSVTLGESSYQHVEIIDGLQDGEKIILTNLNEYNSKKSLKIK